LLKGGEGALRDCQVVLQGHTLQVSVRFQVLQARLGGKQVELRLQHLRGQAGVIQLVEDGVHRDFIANFVFGFSDKARGLPVEHGGLARADRAGAADGGGERFTGVWNSLQIRKRLFVFAANACLVQEKRSSN